jgi:hypothetical protein
MKRLVAAAATCLVLVLARPSLAVAPPGEFRAGGGLYFAPTFVLIGKWAEDADYDAGPTEHYAQDWKYRGFNPGLGIFGEYALSRHVLLGLEAALAFVEVKRFKDTEPASSSFVACTNCDTDVVFSVLLRLKVPFRVAPIVGIYPIVGFGFDLYAAQRSGGGTDARFAGLALVAGFGVEIGAHRFVSPFAEFRYKLGAGWDRLEQPGLTENVSLVTHSLAFLVGVRFP